MKTIKLEGNALALADCYLRLLNSTHQQLEELQAQAKALQEYGSNEAAKLCKEVVDVLDLPKETIVSIDVTYLEAHGVAILRIHEEHNPLLDIFFTERPDPKRTMQ